jgi:hypothetical protein
VAPEVGLERLRVRVRLPAEECDQRPAQLLQDRPEGDVQDLTNVEVVEQGGSSSLVTASGTGARSSQAETW